MIALAADLHMTNESNIQLSASVLKNIQVKKISDITYIKFNFNDIAYAWRKIKGEANFSILKKSTMHTIGVAITRSG